MELNILHKAYLYNRNSTILCHLYKVCLICTISIKAMHLTAIGFVHVCLCVRARTLISSDIPILWQHSKGAENE